MTLKVLPMSSRNLVHTLRRLVPLDTSTDPTCRYFGRDEHTGYVPIREFGVLDVESRQGSVFRYVSPSKGRKGQVPRELQCHYEEDHENPVFFIDRQGK